MELVGKGAFHRTLLRNAYVAKVGEGTVYEVRGPVDTTDSCGKTYSIGLFFNEEAANEAAKGKGFRGGCAIVLSRTEKLVEFFDKDGHWAHAVIGPRVESYYRDPDKIRKEALAKLTDEERKVLGV